MSDEPMRLDGKVAIVTGSATGIGASAARKLAARGAAVVINYSKSLAEAEETKAEIDKAGGKTLLVQADISADADCRRMAQAALDAFGRIDASLHVAGTQGGRDGAIEFTMDEYELMTATNLRGVMFCSQYAAKAMVPTGGGSIVNFTSVAGINGEQLAPLPYTAAKAGVHMVSKVLAIDYARQGVRVNVIAPGFTLTEMMQDATPELLAHMGAKSAIGRPALASEQAEVAAFLASDRASYVTGTVIPVDGGWTARVA